MCMYERKLSMYVCMCGECVSVCVYVRACMRERWLCICVCLCVRKEGLIDRHHLITLQHAPTLYNTLQHTATHCNTLQHTATHCNTRQPTMFAHVKKGRWCSTNIFIFNNYTAAHCSTLQHAATRCNTLQHTIKPCCYLYSNTCHRS